MRVRDLQTFFCNTEVVLARCVWDPTSPSMPLVPGTDGSGLHVYTHRSVYHMYCCMNRLAGRYDCLFIHSGMPLRPCQQHQKLLRAYMYIMSQHTWQECVSFLKRGCLYLPKSRVESIELGFILIVRVRVWRTLCQWLGVGLKDLQPWASVGAHSREVIGNRTSLWSSSWSGISIRTLVGYNILGADMIDPTSSLFNQSSLKNDLHCVVTCVTTCILHTADC